MRVGSGGCLLDVISSEFNLLVPQGKLAECITRLEDALRSLHPTPYHAILGRSFLHHTEAAARYLADFHRRASAGTQLKAIYFEMNGFSINPKQWFCDGFAYASVGDIRDLDWLSDWDAETEEALVLEGMDTVQEAFGRLYTDHAQPLGVRLAGEIAEYLVIARFMELIAEAHNRAKREHPELEGVLVLATAHDWDIIHSTQ